MVPALYAGVCFVPVAPGGAVGGQPVGCVVPLVVGVTPHVSHPEPIVSPLLQRRPRRACFGGQLLVGFRLPTARAVRRTRLRNADPVLESTTVERATLYLAPRGEQHTVRKVMELATRWAGFWDHRANIQISGHARTPLICGVVVCRFQGAWWRPLVWSHVVQSAARRSRCIGGACQPTWSVRASSNPVARRDCYCTAARWCVMTTTR